MKKLIWVLMITLLAGTVFGSISIEDGSPQYVVTKATGQEAEDFNIIINDSLFCFRSNTFNDTYLFADTDEINPSPDYAMGKFDMGNYTEYCGTAQEYFKVGNNTIVIENQTSKKVTFRPYNDTFEIQVTLKWDVNGDFNYTNQVNDIWVRSLESKFGGYYIATGNNEFFKYEVTSQQEIRYYSGDWHVVGDNNKNFKLDFSDICNEYNQSDPAIWDLADNESRRMLGCTFERGSDTQGNITTNFLNVYFADYDGEIDPKIDFAFSSSDVLLDGVRLEEQPYTHLDVNTTASPLVAYWSFDSDRMAGNTVYDLTDNNNDGSFNNLVSLINNSPYFQGLNFPSGNNYIEIPNDASMTLSGDWTYSFWVKQEAGQSSSNGRISARTSFSFEIATDPSGSLQTYSPAMGWGAYNGYSLTQDVWTHAAFVYDGASIDMYIDGVFEGTRAGTALPTGTMRFGQSVTGGSADFNGEIDEFMMFDAELTAGDISDIYNNQSIRFTPLGTQEYLFQENDNLASGTETDIFLADAAAELNTDFEINLAYWDVSKGYDISESGYIMFQDNLTNLYGLTDGTFQNGAALTPAAVVDDGFFFDGNNDYIEIAYDGSIALDGNDLSVGFWMNPNTWDSTVGVFAQDGTESFQIMSTSINRMRLELVGGVNVISGNEFVIPNEWHFYSIVWRDDAVSDVSFYRDGELFTATTTAGVIGNNGNDYFLGAARNLQATYFFDGRIDMWDMVNNNWDLEQVKNRYIRGKMLYDIAPSQTLTKSNETFLNNRTFNVSNQLISYWKFDNTWLDEVGLNNGTPSGATFSANGIFNQSGFFDGVNDYTTVPDTNFPTGSSPRTICSWFNTADTANQNVILGYGQGGSGQQFQVEAYLDTIIFRGSACDVVGSTPTQDDTWHQACFVYDGSNMDLYLDGTLDSSTPLACVNTVASGNARIGRNIQLNNGEFDGEIDELTIYSQALSQSQVSELYGIGSRRFYEANEVPIDVGSTVVQPRFTLNTNPFYTPYINGPAILNEQASVIDLDLNITFSPSDNVTYPTVTTVTGTGCLPGLNCTLFLNGTEVSNPHIDLLGVGSNQCLPVTDHLVISQMSHGFPGVNDEFVEIYNPNPFPIVLNATGVVYRLEMATGSSPAQNPGIAMKFDDTQGVCTTCTDFINGKTIGAFGYYLIVDKLASGSLLAAADAVAYRATFDLPSTRRVVYLGNGTISGPADVDVVDQVGYETSLQFEGAAAAPNFPAGQSIERQPGSPDGNGFDTDENFEDFFIQTSPIPKNTTANSQQCDLPPIHMYTYSTPGNGTVSPASHSANLTVNQGTPGLSIATLPASPVFPNMTTVQGVGCPSQINCNLYRDNVLVSNPDVQFPFPGTYNYVYNTSGNFNYTNASVNISYTVLPGNITDFPLCILKDQINDIDDGIPCVVVNLNVNNCTAVNYTVDTTTETLLSGAPMFAYANTCGFIFFTNETNDYFFTYTNGDKDFLTVADDKFMEDLQLAFALLALFGVGILLVFLGQYIGNAMFFFGAGVWFFLVGALPFMPGIDTVLTQTQGVFAWLLALGIVWHGISVVLNNRRFQDDQS